VLVLFADDLRADTIAAWGNREISTPNLDRLVSGGVSFRNCYNQGGHLPAVCVASRAILLTGKSLWRATSPTGMDSTLLPERFREAGYDTFFTGKWHNGAPRLKRSFDQGGLVLLGGMDTQIRPKLHQFASDRAEPRDGRATPLFTNSLCAFLKQRTKSQKSFFAYCAFTAPHDPREADANDLKLYQGRELALPRPWFPAPLLDNGETKIRDEMVVPAPRTRESCQAELAAYYALITELDRNIGIILKTLEDRQELDRTLIVFAGDNGLALGAHGLMGKQSMYEHSLKVPLLLYGPGFKRQTDSKPMYLSEVYSRLCRHLGMTIPSGVEGPGAPMYFGYRDFQRAVRIGNRKMSWSANTIEQYNLKEDPYEEQNLWGGAKAWDSAPFVAAETRAKAFFADPVGPRRG
jgi:arylsulfatase A-like enzyme